MATTPDKTGEENMSNTALAIFLAIHLAICTPFVIDTLKKDKEGKR